MVKKKAKKISKKKSVVATSNPVVAITPQKRYKTSFYSNPVPIDSSFAKKIQELEKEVGRRVVLLWHRTIMTKEEYSELNNSVYTAFARNINKLKENEKILVVIHSPGGDANPTFRLASLLRKHCGGFDVAIPWRAKSAATLFTLGADKIIMSRFAELGPLDAQIIDREKEERFSALEVVQAIERLNSEAINAVDQQMLFWITRSSKKVDTLLPIAMNFVSELLKPLFDKIDTVNYTGMARILKVAQDYAERLLVNRGVDEKTASDIADKLTNKYSEHGYIIDCDEIKRIGIKDVEEAQGNLGKIIEDIAFMGSKSIMLGPLEEI